jgi:Mn2+/Fe2+ NRAMP family transporter
VNRATGIALGIVAGIGGFVDMGGVITSSQAGALYRYALLWTVVPGIIGFAVYADMSGRITISTGRATFDVIRDRLGGRLALLPLAATVFVDVLTLAVEIAGMALAIRLGLKLPFALLAVVLAGGLVVVLWRVGIELLDNVAAFLGLAMLVTVAAMVHLHPHWGDIGTSLVHFDPRTATPAASYLLMAISLLGAYMTPYQFEFYSSGALEQDWTGEDLLTNRISAIVGTLFGGVITVALMAIAATVLFTSHHDVKSLLDAATPTRTAFGTAGLAVFALGTFAVSAGAGIETALAGSYTVCQFFGWDWGKRQPPREVPLFHLVLLVEFLLAIVVVVSGVDPIRLTVLTMALAAVSLPFIFGPLLIVANDPEYVGEQKNTPMTNVVGLIVFVVLCVVTLSTIPLLILTGGGS